MPNATSAMVQQSDCEPLYKDIVDGSLQGIIIQQDEKIVYANLAMANLFGYRNPTDMIGLNAFEDLIDSEDLSAFRARTASVYKGEVIPLHSGWKGKRRDNKRIWLSSTAYKTKWRGRPAVVSFYLDITSNRNAELALREGEARYRAALIAGQMGAWETDLVAKNRIWTAEGMALFGLVLPEGIGTVGGACDEYLSAIHPDDRHLVKTIYEKANETDSFPAEYRIIRADGQQLWLAGRGQVVARDSRGKAERLISIMYDVSERKNIENRVQMLMHELAHRSSNLIAVVQSIARAISRDVASLEEFHDEFGERLRALAASQHAIASQNFEAASLEELIHRQLKPFAFNNISGLKVLGPDIRLSAEIAYTFGLSIHELATNSVKHGAWSVENGAVSITWEFDYSNSHVPRIILVWKEDNGPVRPWPSRRGFGYNLLYELLPKSLRGDAKADFSAGGFSWTISFPITDKWNSTL